MILHKQVAFIIVKIITTVNFPIKSTDEAPISLPTSITRIMLRSLLKPIQIHKKLLKWKKQIWFDLSSLEKIPGDFWAWKSPLNTN